MRTLVTRLFQRDLEYYPGNMRRIWYLILIVAATMVLYCDGTITSTVLPLVLHAFHLSLAGYSLFAVIAILLSAPVALLGSLSDRFGRANLIIFGLFTCSLIMLGIALATILPVYFALLGSFTCLEAMLYVVAPALVRDFSPRLRRATAMGFWLIGPIGGLILATGTSSLMLTLFDAWQYPYALAGVIGLLVFLLCLLGLHELSAQLRNQVMVSAQEIDRVDAQARQAVPAPSMRGAWQHVLVAIGLAVLGFFQRFFTVAIFLALPQVISRPGWGWTAWWWLCHNWYVIVPHHDLPDGRLLESCTSAAGAECQIVCRRQQGLSRCKPGWIFFLRPY